jgi:hypothetical protein
LFFLFFTLFYLNFLFLFYIIMWVPFILLALMLKCGRFILKNIILLNNVYIILFNLFTFKSFFNLFIFCCIFVYFYTLLYVFCIDLHVPTPFRPLKRFAERAFCGCFFDINFYCLQFALCQIFQLSQCTVLNVLLF